MLRYAIEIDDIKNSEMFLNLLKHLDFVKSVRQLKEEYDWLNPSRPATDDEFEQMIIEAEKEIELGLGIPANKARKQSHKEISKLKH